MNEVVKGVREVRAGIFGLAILVLVGWLVFTALTGSGEPRDAEDAVPSWVEPADGREGSLADRARSAALEAGAASAAFGPARQGEHELFTCGTVDGARAFYRESGRLFVDDGSFAAFEALYASWCGSQPEAGTP